MKILLAIDDSSCSEAAADALLLYPAVRVLHVVEWPGRLPHCYMFARGAAPDGAVFDIRARMIADADGLVLEFSERLRRHGFVTSTFVAVGNPVEEILCCARDWHADLIVMGTHGRTGVDRLAFGSVAERVLHAAHCPVKTVRARALPAAS